MTISSKDGPDQTLFHDLNSAYPYIKKMNISSEYNAYSLQSDVRLRKVKVQYYQFTRNKENYFIVFKM